MGNLCCCFSKTYCDRFLTLKQDSETVAISHENSGFIRSEEGFVDPRNASIFTIENEIRRHSSKRSNKSQNATARRDSKSSIIPDYLNGDTGISDQVDGFQRSLKSTKNEVSTDNLRVKYSGSKRTSVPGSNNVNKEISDEQNDSHSEYQLSVEEFDTYMDTLRVSYASSKRVSISQAIFGPSDGLQNQSKSSTTEVKIDKNTITKPERTHKGHEIRSTYATNAKFLYPKSRMVLNNFRDVINSQNFTKTMQNNNLLEQLFRFCNSESFTQTIDIHNVYRLKILNEHSHEFKTIKRFFFRTNKKYFNIHCIEMVHNPYLLMLYELKKMEYTARGRTFEEEFLFHGTNKSNVEGICRENFNWRLRGSSRGYQFGQGVSFSPIAFYSTHYGDKCYNKVMIIAKVIVGYCCVGAPNMKIPPYGYDTSIKENRHVYVKYDDNSYYPLYLIHYGGNSD